ncbi:prothoracicostatic peptide isoform X2 [Neocloeon triangulifer]|uniref:prothoracicostatic peptide isoform X2 n=1 Tax=Neocloeon triangulifer TaxID=2078957 RepID=UPI00286FA17B|nr:prothoracicostatic peptide isoform X2 [Neocloeon triangulifer]
MLADIICCRRSSGEPGRPTPFFHSLPSGNPKGSAMTTERHLAAWTAGCVLGLLMLAAPSLQEAQQTATAVGEPQALEEDKRGWSDMQSGWGKRGWQDMQGSWGKRAWNNLGSAWGKRDWGQFKGSWGKRAWDEMPPVWGKRAWDKFHGAWGKRTPEEDEQYWSDNDAGDDLGLLGNLDSLTDEELARLASLVFSGNNEPDLTNNLSEEEQKRSWNNLRGAWGKRAWNNFKGSWGKKREPAWNNLKGLWGKRSDRSWNKLASVWGKRSVDGEKGIKQASASQDN